MENEKPRFKLAMIDAETGEVIESWDIGGKLPGGFDFDGLEAEEPEFCWYAASGKAGFWDSSAVGLGIKQVLVKHLKDKGEL